MHLTQVHMENFKSFGRKLTVPFEPGFTGITGPNGSGKSNIGDAILFVLGPNSPRAIRAGRLTDLIFNGGATGKAASYCLVSLEFDNRDRAMPVEADTVTLTRKVKRHAKKDDPDGYNSYFYVNGRASKKREFVDLLNHARISADGYNITQQGDVLQICRMTNAQRRAIVDGIAGVTTFDKDIETAGKRREEVEENLERIGIVLEEIERNLKQLEKEKEAAQKHLELQSEIGRVKGLKAWRRKSDLEANVASVREQITKYEEERVKFEDRHRTLKEALKESQVRLLELEQKIREEGGEEVEEIQRKVQEARDRMVRLEEKIAFAKEELRGGDEDLLPLKEELRKIDKELANTDRIRKEAEGAHATAATDLAARRASLDEMRDLISKSDKGAMALNRELVQLKNEREEKRIELHDQRLLADRHEERMGALRRALDDAETEAEGLATDHKEVAWELDELRKTAGGSGKRHKELERRAFELRKAQAELAKETEDLDGRIRRLQRELSELQARESAAARHGGGRTRAVDEVIAARDDGLIRGIVGTISELASVDEQYQTALETAAGANMNAFVVEDDSVAAQCIELLKQSRAGRAKFLPLNKVVPGRPRGQALMKVKKEGCLGFALDCIDFNQRYHGAFWSVFGDTLVVDRMDNARRLMGGVRMVTLDGELFEAGGAMIGGNQGKKQKGGGFSQSDRGRVDEVLGQITQAEMAHDQATERLSSVRQELHALQEELDAHGRSGRSGEEQLKDLEKRELNLRQRLERAQADLERCGKELAEGQGQADAFAQRIAALDGRLAELEGVRQEKAQLLLKGSKKEWRDRIEALEKDILDLQSAVLEAENRMEIASKQAELVAARRQEITARIESFSDDREKYERQVQDYGVALEKAEAEVKALLAMEHKATAKLGDLRDRKDAAYQEITDFKVKVEKVADRMETHAHMVINARSKLPALEEALGEALVELKEHPVEVGPDEDVPPFDELRRTLRSLEGRLERLGPVNQRALEEYDAQAVRKEDLDAEVARLKDQRGELVKLVEDISTRKKDAFMVVYHAINANFTEVYADLSLGGKAYMELEDPEDPFNGGLILKAQPMGKRVTRLDALSGGEKSLTSMAFIFAIQRFDPSPFYYFDEVDQNLDAVNSELLARMVKKNAQFAQFIVVSLRKITLKESSYIYGVTQQVPGISEMIADFRLEDVEEEEPSKPADGGLDLADGRGDTADDGKDGAGSDDDDPADGDDDGLTDSIKGMIQVEVGQ